MSHDCNIPEPIWKWAQQKSGKINPASWIREEILWPAYVSDMQNGESEITEKTAEDKWADVGLGLNPMDGPETPFATARSAFSHSFGGDVPAINWFKDAKNRGIRDNRAFLMSWWNRQKPQAL